MGDGVDSSTAEAWQGRLHLGPDLAVFSGEVGDNEEHAHFAHQIVRAPAGVVAVSVNDQPEQGACVGIASRQRHRILHAPSPAIIVFAEPLGFGLAALQAAVALAAPSVDAVVRAAAACRAAPALDPRVGRALDELDRLLDTSVSGKILADSVHLSLSQLERLLSSQVGLPARRLVLWRRLRAAVAAVAEGQNLTSAAHLAGFADSAHLSRTMKAMFGVRADRSLLKLSMQVMH